MTNFEIITDGSAEFFEGYLEKESIKVLPILLDEKGYHPVALKDAFEAMEEILNTGKDVLYIGMTAALSKSFENVEYIAKGLRIKYPDRKIEFINSLTTSASLGMLVYYAKKLQNAGKTINDVYDFVNEFKKKSRNLFILENPTNSTVLGYSNTQNSTLDIKPIFDLDDEGKFRVATKIIGRKKTINELIRMVKTTYNKDYCDYIAVEYIEEEIEAEDLKNKLSLEIPNIPIKLLKANEFAAKQMLSPGVGVAFIAK